MPFTLGIWRSIRITEDEDADMRAGSEDALGRFDAVYTGHLEIHQDHIGLEVACPCDDCLAVGRLAGQFQVTLGLEECAEALAERCVVVGDEDASQFHWAAPGRTRRMHGRHGTRQSAGGRRSKTS
jgi:hypothetical protein